MSDGSFSYSHSFTSTYGSGTITITGNFNSSTSASGTFSYTRPDPTGVNPCHGSGTWTATALVPSCTYSISPTSSPTFPSGGGAGSIAVTTQNGCLWTTMSNVQWINITSGSSGTGSGTVSYSVGANSGQSSRTGNITVAEKTFTINQASLNSYALTVNKSGMGNGAITSSPAGINCGDDCSETYDQGTVITLTASPWSGSSFTGWSGEGCSGTGQCVVTMNAAKTVTATFSLIQTGMPKMSVSPHSLNFGSMKADASAQKMVTISNSGTGQLLVNSISISGVSAAEFSQTNNCSALASKGICTVTLTFNPTLPFGKKVASLTISSNDPKKGTISVNLAGQASASKISVKPSSLSFGTMIVGGTPATKTINVFNKGLSDLLINSMDITGTNVSEFSQTNDCGTVQTGGTCTISVTYTPNDQTGKKSAILVISSNDPKKPNLNVKLNAWIK
jgi:hypothetical protein